MKLKRTDPSVESNKFKFICLGRSSSVDVEFEYILFHTVVINFHIFDSPQIVRRNWHKPAFYVSCITSKKSIDSKYNDINYALYVSICILMKRHIVRWLCQEICLAFLLKNEIPFFHSPLVPFERMLNGELKFTKYWTHYTLHIMNFIEFRFSHLANSFKYSNCLPQIAFPFYFSFRSHCAVVVRVFR